MSQISSNRRNGDNHNGTYESDCDRVEVGGLVNGNPSEIAEGLLEEEGLRHVGL